MSVLTRIFLFLKKLHVWDKINFIKWRKQKTPLYKILRAQDFPDEPKPYILYLFGKSGHEWLAGMVCPCGCEEFIELVLEGEHPRWKLFISEADSPSLSPSVYRSIGCRSHFFLEHGTIYWCSPSPKH